MRNSLSTPHAPKAIGAYSQAIQVENLVYLSGQIPLNPQTMELVSTDIREQINQVFTNMQKVCETAGGSLNDLVKITVYLMDFAHFAYLNEAMQAFFKEPYPARTTIQVAGLPKNALIEVEGIMHLP